MKSDALKNLAIRAKNRLLNKNLRNTYSTAEIKIIDRQDNDFFNRVKELTANNHTISNPLKHLRNQVYMKKLVKKFRKKLSP